MTGPTHSDGEMASDDDQVLSTHSLRPRSFRNCLCLIKQDGSWQLQVDGNSTNVGYRPGVPRSEGRSASEVSVRFSFFYTSMDKDGLLLANWVSDR